MFLNPKVVVCLAIVSLGLFLSPKSYGQIFYSIQLDTLNRVYFAEFYSNAELSAHIDQGVDGTRVAHSITTGLALSEVVMKNGRMNGHFRVFNDQGILIEKGFAINGEFHGTFFYWNDNGFLVRKEEWEMGELIDEIIYQN